MKCIGRHFLVEVRGCDSKILNDIQKLEDILVTAAKKSKAHVLNVYSHTFEPQGTTCVVALQESHISIHTYPEIGFSAIDFFTCGKINPQIGINYIIKKLKSKNTTISEIKRGVISNKEHKKILAGR